MAHKPREIHFYYVFKIIAQLWFMIVMIHLLLVGCTPKCDRRQGVPHLIPNILVVSNYPFLIWDFPKMGDFYEVTMDFKFQKWIWIIWGYLWVAPWLVGNLHFFDPRPCASASATHSGRKPCATHSRAKAAWNRRIQLIASMAMQQEPIDWRYLPYIFGLFLRPM